MVEEIVNPLKITDFMAFADQIQDLKKDLKNMSKENQKDVNTAVKHSFISALSFLREDILDPAQFSMIISNLLAKPLSLQQNQDLINQIKVDNSLNGINTNFDQLKNLIKDQFQESDKKLVDILLLIDQQQTKLDQEVTLINNNHQKMLADIKSEIQVSDFVTNEKLNMLLERIVPTPQGPGYDEELKSDYQIANQNKAVKLSQEENIPQFNAIIQPIEKIICKPGEEVQLHINITNNGKNEWPENTKLYRVFLEEDKKVNEQVFNLPKSKVKVGESVNINVDIQVPMRIGEYNSIFILKNIHDIGEVINVTIEVKDSEIQ